MELKKILKNRKAYLLRCEQKIRLGSNKVIKKLAWVPKISVTLFFIALLLIFCIFLKSLPHDLDSSSTVLAIGGTMGTIIAVAFGLSIIPIQRAAEVGSISLILAGIKNRLTRVILMLLSIICLITFIISDKSIFSIPSYARLFSSVLLLSITLDLIRYYYQYVSNLLNPYTMADIITNNTKKKIWKASKFIKSNSRKISRALQTPDNNISSQQIEFQLDTHYKSNFIMHYFNEMAELTLKFATQSEISITLHIIKKMTETLQLYISSRKNNLYVNINQNLEKKTNINEELNSFCEALLGISKKAAVMQEEKICLESSRAYINLISFLANLEFSGGSEFTIVTLGKIMFFLEISLSIAAEKELLEVPFQTSQTILEEIQKINNYFSIYDLYLPIINLLFAQSHTQKNRFLSSVIVERAWKIVIMLFLKNHDQFLTSLGMYLKNLENVIELDCLIESKKLTINQGRHPSFDNIYTSIDGTSISYLISELIKNVKKNSGEKEPDKATHNYFIEVSNKINQHFRKLADNNNFSSSSSSLFINILTCIKEITDSYLELVRYYDERNYFLNYGNEVIDSLNLLLSSLWASFKNKDSINREKAMWACDIASYVAIVFSERNWYAHKLMNNCISIVCSITDSYSGTIKDNNLSQIARFLIYAYKIYKFAAVKGLKLEELRPLASTNEEEWKMVLKYFEEEKNEFDKTLERDLLYAKSSPGFINRMSVLNESQYALVSALLKIVSSEPPKNT